jgi:cholesterol transport system auxiliary component
MVARVARALLPLVLGVSGCLLTSSGPDPVVAYPLEVTTSVAESEPVAWQLAIEVPVARGPLEDDRITLRSDAEGYGALANARWSHRATELVQDAIVRSFEDAGRVPGIVRSSVGSRSDYLLLTELRVFEVTTDDEWFADVVLSAKLVRMKGMRVLAGKVFRARAPAGGGVKEVVDAFEVATSKVLDELRGWVVETGQEDWREQAPRDAEP